MINQVEKSDDDLSKGVGISLLTDTQTPTEILSYVMEAERNGLKSAWLTEHYGSGNPFPILGALATTTKKIRLGTGVVSGFLHHPLVLGTTAATLATLSNGRFILGVGTGVREWIEQNLNLEFDPVLTRMEECVRIIRDIVDKGRTDFRGMTWTVRNARLLPKPNSFPLPIYMAAVGKRMMSLASKIADGAILSACSSLRYVEEVRQTIQKTRPSSKPFEVVGLILVSIDKNSKLAKQRAKPYVASVLSRPGRAEQMLGKEGPGPEEIHEIHRAVRENKLSHAATLISDRVVDQVAAAGTQEECLEFITQIMKNGVTVPALLPHNVDMRAFFKFAKKVDSLYG